MRINKKAAAAAAWLGTTELLLLSLAALATVCCPNVRKSAKVVPARVLQHCPRDDFHGSLQLSRLLLPPPPPACCCCPNLMLSDVAGSKATTTTQRYITNGFHLTPTSMDGFLFSLFSLVILSSCLLKMQQHQLKRPILL
jgi:hypothetical protein